MTARESFRIGDRVQYAPTWLTGERQQRDLIVVGYGRKPELVRVRVIGKNATYTYPVTWVERRTP